MRGFPPADIFTAQALRTADPQISCVCAQCARRAAAQVAPDTGPSAHAHTPGSRERLPSRELPRRLPLPARPRSGNVVFIENFPTVPTDRVRPLAKNLGTRSSWGGLWGVHEQYLSNLWATGHAVLCAWKPEKRSFTHSKSHDWLLSVRFFPEPFRELKTTQCGG